jgi:HAE1 family hydrophobic/amphiphilic exporter-1
MAVRRPIFTIMVVLIVIILGGVSLQRLPIDLMPDITYPTLSISCAYENAGPEEIEELLTRPIEEAMSAVPGVEEVTSISSEGNSNVRVTFSWGTDLDAAASDIRDRLDRVIPRLPDEAERPTLRKFDLASFPILICGASGRLDPVQMRQLIEDQVKQRIERVPGVAALDVWGGLEREIHVDLDAAKVKALGLPLDTILDRIREGNVALPAGTIDRGDLEVTIRTPGEYADLDQLRDTVVAVREGAAVRLSEIADVRDSWRKVTRMVRIGGEPGLRLSVSKQSGKNTVEVARGVLKEIEQINRDLPQLHITPIIDTSDYIERSISNVGSVATYGGMLALLVLLVFLRNARSTAVIAAAIPVSVIAAFALMYFGGFTLNLMTLGGLALGIGMLVDNSIVVVENIFRLRETGRPPAPAAVDGSEEVTAAIIASTLTTVVVFLPMIFMRGMSGVMFKQLATVVGFAILCSLGVALTLVPMLSARIPAAPNPGGGGRTGPIGRLHHLTGRFFASLEVGYKRLLHFALAHRPLVVIGAVGLLAGSVALIPHVGVELMPATDEGEVRVSAEMAVGTRVDVLDEKLQGIASTIARHVPETENMVSSAGGSHWRGLRSHRGDIRIALRPEAKRPRSSEDIAVELRRQLQGIAGVVIRTRPGRGLFLLRMGSSGSDRIEVEIRGHDLDVADALAERVRQVVESVEGVTDAQISRESGSPEELIRIDRLKAADMKLTVSDIATALQTVLSGTSAGNYREAGDEYPIRVQVRDAQKMSLSDILDLTISNADGEPIVLRNAVTVQPRSGPVTIERKDQQRVVTVSADFAGRDMGSVLADIRRGLAAVPVPRGFSIAFGGDYEEQQKAFRELLLSCVLALLLVYMVMACLYESLRDPFVVMFSVPMAAIGVVLMLFLTGTTFNVQSFIGCIMLGGIVVNNAILLVDHTNLLRRRDGLPLREAIEEAGRRRLRPILMTATTTSLALVPLALGLGEGAEAQAPMARAVIGGLCSSTLITLVFVPVVYSIFERRTGGERPSAAPAE